MHQKIVSHNFAEETWKYVMEKSRDQDLMYYFSGLSSNVKMRRFLVTRFRESYELVWVTTSLRSAQT